MKKTISLILSLVMLFGVMAAIDCSAFAATASVKSVSLSTTTYTYDGKAKKPTVTAKDNKGKKISTKYYTVKYPSGRKAVGKYTVKVTFKGKFKSAKTKSKTFTIKPKSTSLSSVSAASKGFTVKWKKLTTQTTGYQIQYATNSKFTSAKTATISKNSTTSKSVSSLTPRKKYYVRVRTYKTVKVNGKSTKIYSSWSSSKSVTTKTGLKISKSSVTIFNGEAYTLKVTNTSKKVSWSSSDTKVATVNQSGKVSAVGSGTCTIKAKISNDYITCKIVVPEYNPENYNVPDFGAYFSVRLVDYDYNPDTNLVYTAFSAASVYNVNESWLEDYADKLGDYGFAYQGYRDSDDGSMRLYYFQRPATELGPNMVENMIVAEDDTYIYVIYEDVQGYNSK
ncbi:MAG: Ig-like domain-containing protein [Eubacterium sp.]|nr:Ig-like domain-containing protein [Eubacterium sp.]